MIDLKAPLNRILGLLVRQQSPMNLERSNIYLSHNYTLNQAQTNKRLRISRKGCRMHAKALHV